MVELHLEVVQLEAAGAVAGVARARTRALRHGRRDAGSLLPRATERREAEGTAAAVARPNPN